MSTVALAGGVALYFMLRPYLLTAEGPPLLRHLKGQRHLRLDARHAVLEIGKMAGEHPRHEASAAATPAAGGLRVRRRPGAALRARDRSRRSSPPTDFDLAFALVWAVGIACALGAAYLGQVPSPGGPDPARGRGPRHLHQLRLAVRPGPRADAACRRDGNHRPPASRPALAAEAHRESRRSEALSGARSDGIASATSSSRSPPAAGWRRSLMRR